MCAKTALLVLIVYPMQTDTRHVKNLVIRSLTIAAFTNSGLKKSTVKETFLLAFQRLFSYRISSRIVSSSIIQCQLEKEVVHNCQNDYHLIRSKIREILFSSFH